LGEFFFMFLTKEIGLKKKIKIGSVYWTTNFATFLEKFNNFWISEN